MPNPTLSIDNRASTSSTLLNSEVAIASSVVFILLVMVVPLPSLVLDLLLATNISISLAVLLTAFYAEKPLDFAIFPGLLLLTTLFRLSLNVASTRLILSEGEAGALIAAFGRFVVAGNYVVGMIIFLVLVIINFVVITKGSGRIAEVAARFTLDALPGKQMAIDADLNSGLIDEQEAKERRKEVTSEADFYGAMDGASKFVRGDAVAGLIITGINIVGGLIVGVAQQQMSFEEATANFVLLSIGDGLVSQIPALLISTAAGIIVSRASSDSNLAASLQEQLFNHPTPLLLTGIFLFLLGLVPGLPLLPFWVLAGGLVYLGRNRQRQEQKEIEEEALALQEELEPEEQEKPSDLLLVDPLELEIGYSLITLVDENQGGDLLERIKSLRKQLALELGLVIPPLRIRDNASMERTKYIFKLRGNPIGEGEILPDSKLVLLGEDTEDPPPGVQVKDPTFGLPAVWVAQHNIARAEERHLTIVEPASVVTTHLLEELRKNAHQLLNRQEVKKLIDKVKEKAPALVDELIPDMMSLGSIQKVLRNLLKERVPIRDLVTLLEAMADYATQTQNEDVLTEYCRAALAPTITRQFSNNDGTLNVVTLDPALEQAFIQNANGGTFNANTLGLQPQQAEMLIAQAEQETRKLVSSGFQPILLTSPVLRSTVYRFLAPMLNDINVLSYNDLTSDADVKIMGQLTLQTSPSQATTA